MRLIETGVEEASVDRREDALEVGLDVLPRLDAGALTLDSCRLVSRRAPEAVEEGLGRATGNDGIRDGIRVLLEWIGRAAINRTFELNASRLLHDVRGLVGRGMQICRAVCERHVATRCVRARS